MSGQSAKHLSSFPVTWSTLHLHFTGAGHLTAPAPLSPSDKPMKSACDRPVSQPLRAQGENTADPTPRPFQSHPAGGGPGSVPLPLLFMLPGLNELASADWMSARGERCSPVLPGSPIMQRADCLVCSLGQEYHVLTPKAVPRGGGTVSCPRCRPARTQDSGEGWCLEQWSYREAVASLCRGGCRTWACPQLSDGTRYRQGRGHGGTSQPSPWVLLSHLLLQVLLPEATLLDRDMD